MRTPIFLFLIVLALAVAGFVGIIGYYTFAPQSLRHSERSEESRTNARSAATPSAPSRPILRSTDPVRGDPTAQVAIVEFGDFLCPACAEMEPVLARVLETHQGKVKLIWKDLPNTVRHPLAEQAALAARCAGEQGGISLRSTGSPSASQPGGFWQYHDLLFEKLEQGQSLTEEGLSLAARDLNLNMSTFTQCLQSGRMKDVVNRDLNEALLLGVDGTPYFFVGSQRFSGAISEAQLTDALAK